MNKNILKIFLIVFSVILNFLLANCQLNKSVTVQGSVLKGKVLESQITGTQFFYSVYLPPNYEKSSQRYPVIYLLHGYSGKHNDWTDYGKVHESSDSLIQQDKIQPMIIVMPEANVQWYMNATVDSLKIEDMMIQELIPHIDHTFRTWNHRKCRAVAGLSMGGHGALIFALHHPDLYSACVAFSAGLFADEEISEMDEKTYHDWFPKIYGGDINNRFNANWQKNNPIHLVNTMRIEDLEKVKFYIDCGDDDFLYRSNAMLHIALRKRVIPHEYRIRDGNHHWDYWREGIVDGLEFISNIFEGKHNDQVEVK